MKTPRHCHTTLSGVAAALGALGSASGVLPPPFNVVAAIVGAMGLAFLGHAAADKKVVNKMQEDAAPKKAL